MRRLLIIPIVHTAADLGRLEHQLEQLKRDLLPETQVHASKNRVNLFWNELRSAIEGWDLCFENTIIFQDALPTVHNDSNGLIHKIINDLAAAGSLNHQLLKWLMQRGATVVGTESPELLVAEYKIVKASLDSRSDDSGSQDASLLSAEETEHQLADLLMQRDQFIAQRIDDVLSTDQTGIVFLGMLHQLEKWLADDIEFEFPIGRPSNINTNEQLGKLPTTSHSGAN